MAEENSTDGSANNNDAPPSDQPLYVYRPLPADRRSLTHKFVIGGHEGYFHVGIYDDGKPAEVFIRLAKEGSVVCGLADSFATAISILLQHGVPLAELSAKFIGVRFEPCGLTEHPEIPRASSVVDYLFKWMNLAFPGKA